MNKLIRLDEYRVTAARRRKREREQKLVCAWVHDDATGALLCRWIARRRERAPALDVPLRRAA